MSRLSFLSIEITHIQARSLGKDSIEKVGCGWLLTLRSSVSASSGVAGHSRSLKPPVSGPPSPPPSSQVTGVSCHASISVYY